MILSTVNSDEPCPMAFTTSRTIQDSERRKRPRHLQLCRQRYSSLVGLYGQGTVSSPPTPDDQRRWRRKQRLSRTFMESRASGVGKRIENPLRRLAFAPGHQQGSRPKGLHLRPLAERCVSLSTHTAPIRQTRRPSFDAMYEQSAPLVGNGPNHLASLYFPSSIALVLPHCPRNQCSVDILPHRTHCRWGVAPIVIQPAL